MKHFFSVFIYDLCRGAGGANRTMSKDLAWSLYTEFQICGSKQSRHNFGYCPVILLERLRSSVSFRAEIWIQDPTIKSRNATRPIYLYVIALRDAIVQTITTSSVTRINDRKYIWTKYTVISKVIQKIKKWPDNYANKCTATCCRLEYTSSLKIAILQFYTELFSIDINCHVVLCVSKLYESVCSATHLRSSFQARSSRAIHWIRNRHNGCAGQYNIPSSLTWNRTLTTHAVGIHCTDCAVLAPHYKNVTQSKNQHAAWKAVK